MSERRQKTLIPVKGEEADEKVLSGIGILS
ncbi:hypothetical protein HNP60_000091 [Sphingobium sp. B1D3A]|uniref:Uncharacterized protein n=1 Tax=Sphingobium lignivorans TaxID=2735886 RepID=A0ABR6NA16_9SPHN|nr:hypothetical protein [Sphingobium lignivorans]